MSQKALLFMPDISGFTEFVHHTSITHSRHIISELLELLLDTNPMQFELAEIEGDALFLYKLQDTVDVKALEKQIEAMYLAFHTHLKRYEYQRICQCGACTSAYNLKLKFVAHYGEIEFIKVKTSEKPYGSNVIQIHRLLKNEVPLSEYSLFTEQVLPLSGEQQATQQYDFGAIDYTYKPLSQLKELIPKIELIPDDVPKHKLFDETEIIKISVNNLYEVISNFDYRLLWTKGVDKLEYEKNKVNRVGEKHKCLFNKNDDIVQTTIAKSVEKNQLVYGESTNDIPFTKKFNSYFILEEAENGFTKLNIQAYADFQAFGIIFKPLIKKGLRKRIPENIKQLIILIDSGFSPNMIHE